MPGSALYAVIYLAVLCGIVIVDAGLGEVAEYFNAYELLRHTAGLPRDVAPFIRHQDRLGTWASVVAWLVFFVEGALITALLWVVSRPFT